MLLAFSEILLSLLAYRIPYWILQPQISPNSTNSTFHTHSGSKASDFSLAVRAGLTATPTYPANILFPPPPHLTPTVTKACPFDLAFDLDLSGHRKFTLDVYAGTDLSAEKFQTSGHKFHFLLGGHCEQSYFLLLFQSLGHWADTQVTLLTRRLHFCDYKWDHEDSERDGENSGLCCRCVLLKSGFCFCFFVFLQF